MEIIQYSLQILLFLFCAALVAGFIDTLAGGGGLITVPALMMTGIPPIFALGTNKLQGTAGTATSSFMMFKKSQVNWQEIKGLAFSAFLGATIGTIAVQFIYAESLKILIPIVLAVIAIYFLFSPQLTHTNTTPQISHQGYRNYVIPVIGAYDGILGPGTGSFFNLSGIALRGLNIIQSTANAKVFNFATNIASLIVFIFSGKIVWVLGGVMMLGQIIGAWLGAHRLLKINPQHLRYLVVAICVSMLAKYCFFKHGFF